MVFDIMKNEIFEMEVNKEGSLDKYLQKHTILIYLDFERFYRSEIKNLRQPNGKGWASGLCPFHNDNRPSFSVNIYGGYFRCFACGEKGTVFNFYMKKNAVDYGRAVFELYQILLSQ